jgi:hypothetical protein
MTGWEPAGSPFPPADQFADLNRLAQRYRDEPALNKSQFWYHAEFFDFPRLRDLFNDARTTNKTNNDFMTLLEPFSGSPALLTDPALICYYLFYPRHDEVVRASTKRSSSEASLANGPASRCCSIVRIRVLRNSLA